MIDQDRPTAQLRKALYMHEECFDVSENKDVFGNGYVHSVI